MPQTTTSEPDFLKKAITGDESWVHSYDLDTKGQLCQWKLPGSPHLKKAWQSHSKIKTMLTVFWLGRCCPSWVHSPLQEKQLIRSTTSIFFISWEMQYNENSCSCGQLVIGSFIMTMHLLTHPVSYRVFLVKHPITQVTQPPYSPNLAPCDFWLFQKLKSPLKQKTFQTNRWDLGKYNEAADGNWEICVRS